MGATATLNELYADGMQLSGQQLYGNLPIAQLSAAASWATGATTVVMAQTVPSWVISGLNIYDVTKGANMGTVTGSTGTTLSASSSFSAASFGAADVLQFGFTPSDMAVGAAAGSDIRGLVQVARLHCAEAIAILNYLKTDVITSGQDAAANTLIASAVTSLS